jgi:hypothetical protein
MEYLRILTNNLTNSGINFLHVNIKTFFNNSKVLLLVVKNNFILNN